CRKIAIALGTGFQALPKEADLGFGADGGELLAPMGHTRRIRYQEAVLSRKIIERFAVLRQEIAHQGPGIRSAAIQLRESALQKAIDCLGAVSDHLGLRETALEQGNETRFNRQP